MNFFPIYLTYAYNSSDLEHMSGESSKIQELEQENRKLNQTCSIDKR